MTAEKQTSPATTAATQRRAHFDVILSPHRSLGPRGFIIFMTVVTLVSFAAGLSFTLMGAWPVLGFFGLDVLAIYIAFRLSYRSARMREVVQLFDDELILQRRFPNGQIRIWSFQPYWVRLSLDQYSATAGALRLSSHGRQVSFGRFLNTEEREALADALRTALQSLKKFQPT